MTTYNQRQVLLVPVLFSDKDQEKPRPAVVLSSRAYNTTCQRYIIAAVSSSVPNSLREDEILIKGTELAEAGLPKESIVKVGVIFTIDPNRVIKSLGELTPATFNKVLHCLLKIVGAR